MKTEPRKFVRMFQPRFVPAIESGQKIQTIRLTPKRMPKFGDILSIRIWTGMPYRSKQRIIMEKPISQVYKIKITWPWNISLHGLSVPVICLDQFAINDGFKDWTEMWSWFDFHYSLPFERPFEGIVIRWAEYPEIIS